MLKNIICSAVLYGMEVRTFTTNRVKNKCSLNVSSNHTLIGSGREASGEWIQRFALHSFIHSITPLPSLGHEYPVPRSLLIFCPLQFLSIHECPFRCNLQTPHHATLFLGLLPKSGVFDAPSSVDLTKSPVVVSF